MKIEVIQHGITHYHTYCNDCDFEADIFDDSTPDEKDVRNAVYRHISKSDEHAVPNA